MLKLHRSTLHRVSDRHCLCKQCFATSLQYFRSPVVPGVVLWQFSDVLRRFLPPLQRIRDRCPPIRTTRNRQRLLSAITYPARLLGLGYLPPGHGGCSMEPLAALGPVGENHASGPIFGNPSPLGFAPIVSAFFKDPYDGREPHPPQRPNPLSLLAIGSVVQVLPKPGTQSDGLADIEHDPCKRVYQRVDAPPARSQVLVEDVAAGRVAHLVVATRDALRLRRRDRRHARERVTGHDALPGSTRRSGCGYAKGERMWCASRVCPANWATGRHKDGPDRIRTCILCEITDRASTRSPARQPCRRYGCLGTCRPFSVLPVTPQTARRPAGTRTRTTRTRIDNRQRFDPYHRQDRRTIRLGSGTDMGTPTGRLRRSATELHPKRFGWRGFEPRDHRLPKR